MGIDEIPDFPERIDAFLQLRHDQGEVVRHAGIDRQGDVDVIGGGLFQQLRAVVQEQFVAAGLYQYGRQARQVGVERRQARVPVRSA